MQLYIIRHAQSTNNALADQTQRVYDPPLTEVGRAQADLLAAHLCGSEVRDPALRRVSSRNNGPERIRPFDRVYCSPMRRALLTAAPFAAALQLRVEVWPDICEEGGLWQDHGGEIGTLGYRGMTRADIEAHFRGFTVPAEVSEHGWWDGTRESDSAFEQRVRRVASTLRERSSTPETLAIVAHGAFINALLGVILRGNIDEPLFYHHDNTGMTRLRLRPSGEVSVRYLNRVDHLPSEMVT